MEGLKFTRSSLDCSDLSFVWNTFSELIRDELHVLTQFIVIRDSFRLRRHSSHNKRSTEQKQTIGSDTLRPERVTGNQFVLPPIRIEEERQHVRVESNVKHGLLGHEMAPRPNRGGAHAIYE